MGNKTCITYILNFFASDYAFICMVCYIFSFYIQRLSDCFPIGRTMFLILSAAPLSQATTFPMHVSMMFPILFCHSSFSPKLIGCFYVAEAPFGLLNLG